MNLEPHHPYPPHRGEIVIIGSEPGRPPARAHMLTLGRLGGFGGRRVFRGLLCTNLVEMATDCDLILDRHSTGARYTLLAQGELYGYFHIDQIVAHLGTIDPATRRRVPDLINDGVGDGLPLAGPSDPRWKFKHDELYRMYEATLNPFDLVEW